MYVAVSESGQYVIFYIYWIDFVYTNEYHKSNICKFVSIMSFEHYLGSKFITNLITKYKRYDPDALDVFIDHNYSWETTALERLFCEKEKVILSKVVLKMMNLSSTRASYKRKRKYDYQPSIGVKTDFETLLQQFSSFGTVRYEKFAECWKALNMSCYCAGRQSQREAREVCSS